MPRSSKREKTQESGSPEAEAKLLVAYKIFPVRGEKSYQPPRNVNYKKFLECKRRFGRLHNLVGKDRHNQKIATNTRYRVSAGSYKRRYWKKEELDFLKNHRYEPVRVIAWALGRSINSINRVRQRFPELSSLSQELIKF